MQVITLLGAILAGLLASASTSAAESSAGLQCTFKLESFAGIDISLVVYLYHFLMLCAYPTRRVILLPLQLSLRRDLEQFPLSQTSDFTTADLYANFHFYRKFHRKDGI